jgi:CheY-like chemotaxis protein
VCKLRPFVDEETRRPLVSNLRGYGYRVAVAVDEEDALERVVGVDAPAADLVLVNLIGETADEVLGEGRRVRQHAGYDGHTPLVAMREKHDKELEDTEVNDGARTGSSTSVRCRTGCVTSWRDSLPKGQLPEKARGGHTHRILGFTKEPLVDTTSPVTDSRQWGLISSV